MTLIAIRSRWDLHFCADDNTPTTESGKEGCGVAAIWSGGESEEPFALTQRQISYPETSLGGQQLSKDRDRYAADHFTGTLFWRRISNSHWSLKQPLYTRTRGTWMMAILNIHTQLGNQTTALAIKGQHFGEGPRDCTGNQGPALWWKSRGLHWQSRASTLVKVQATALAIEGQHFDDGPRDCIGIKGQHSSESPGDRTGSHPTSTFSGSPVRQSPLCVYRILYLG